MSGFFYSISYLSKNQLKKFKGVFMIQNSKKSQNSIPKNISELKDDDLAPKGRTKHIVETDWPTKESLPVKKRKIKKTETARLP